MFDGNHWLSIGLQTSAFKVGEDRFFTIIITDEQREYELTSKILASKQQLASLLQNTPARICLMEQNGELSFANKNFQQQFLANQTTKRSINVIELLPSPFAKVLRSVQNDIFAGKRCPIKEVYVSKGDNAGYYTLTTFPVPKDNQNTNALACVILDISETKRSEIQLRSTQTKLSELVKNAPLAIIEWDESLKITFWNQAASEIFGYQPQQALGQTIIQLFGGLDSQHSLEINLVNAVKHGKFYSPDIKLMTKSGHIIYTDWRSFQVTRENDGELRFSSMITDVTKMTEIIASLKLKEAEKEEVLQSMVDPVITIDQFGKILTFNNAASSLFLYQVEDVIGKNIKILMPDDIASKHDNFLIQYMRTGNKKVIG